eukprot:1585992-Prorocentrum_lima.AAC.1
MTSSLVGSEMCIRDSSRGVSREDTQCSGGRSRCPVRRSSPSRSLRNPGAVSYTHLTLPTICSV